MLQTDHGSAPQLVLFRSIEDIESTAAPSAKSAEFLRVFEEVTGWQVEFQKSDSIHQSSFANHRSPAPSGKFEIVDMSEAWPSRKPTAHRGLCDHLISLFSELTSELEQVRSERDLAEAKLSALDTAPAGAGELLVDSFPVKFGDSQSLESSLFIERRDPNQAGSELIYQSVFLDQDNEPGEEEFELAEDYEEYESDFVVHQEVSSWQPSMPGAWENWSMGGASGFASSTYLDWHFASQKLTIVVGKLDGNPRGGDLEISIEIDPENSRYRVKGETSIQAFFTWDRRGGRTQPANLSGAWNPIYPGAAIICTTNPAVHNEVESFDLQTDSTAEEMAQAFASRVPGAEKILVLKRVE